MEGFALIMKSTVHGVEARGGLMGALSRMEGKSLESPLLIFLSRIESHSLRRMETFGLGPGCGTSPVLGDSTLS